MKKILLFTLLTTLSVTLHAQKKKVTKKATPVKPVVLAKNEPNNIEAEFLNNTIYVYYTADNKRDTLFTEKTIDKINAENFNIKEFKVNNKNLILFSWNEVISKKTDLLKEELFLAENQIWDFESKKRLVKNKQKRGSSEQIRFLSKQKDASETIYSKVSDGRSFALLANGDYTLSSDKGTDKFVYDPSKNEYKVVVPKSTTKKTTRRR